MGRVQVFDVNETLDLAARAGCATGFVARLGKVPDPLVERPDIVGADLAEVADGILAADK